MVGGSSEGHIRRFLKDHPDGHLFVVAGYASVWGLAWLQENARTRRVTLIIGDTRDSRFQNATDSDRREALVFLRRRDVRVLNWYRTARSSLGASMVHAKSWIVADPKKTSALAAMIGSANLTKEGLQNNWEMMARVAEDELPRLWSQLDGFLTGRSGNKVPWDAAERLVGIIEASGRDAERAKSTRVRRSGAKPAPVRRSPAKRPPAKRPPARRKGGCFPLVAAMAATVAAILIAMLLLLF